MSDNLKKFEVTFEDTLADLKNQCPDIKSRREILMYMFASVLAEEPLVDEMQWGMYALRISRMLHLVDLKVVDAFQTHDNEFDEFLKWKEANATRSSPEKI